MSIIFHVAMLGLNDCLFLTASVHSIFHNRQMTQYLNCCDVKQNVP